MKERNSKVSCTYIYSELGLFCNTRVTGMGMCCCSHNKGSTTLHYCCFTPYVLVADAAMPVGGLSCGRLQRNKLYTWFNELFKIEMKQILNVLTLVYCTIHRSRNQLTCLMDIYSTLRFVYPSFLSISCVLSQFCLVIGFYRFFNNPFNLFLRYSVVDIRISIC